MSSEDNPRRPVFVRLTNSMDGQLSFASLDFAGKKKRTKRDEFLAEMESLPALLDIVRAKVLPERLKTKDNATGKILKKEWWRFFRPKDELYDRIKVSGGAILIPRDRTHYEQLPIKPRTIAAGLR